MFRPSIERVVVIAEFVPNKVVVVVIVIVENLTIGEGKAIVAVVTGVAGVLHLQDYYLGSLVLLFLQELDLFFCNLGFGMDFGCVGRLGSW